MLPSKHDNFSKLFLPKYRFDLLKLHCICMYNSSSVNLINYVLLYDRSGRKKIVVWLEMLYFLKEMYFTHLKVSYIFLYRQRPF